MTNLEQAKRLKDAGFPMNTCEMAVLPNCHDIQGCPKNTMDCKEIPSEKDLMDWIVSQTNEGQYFSVMWCTNNKWWLIRLPFRLSVIHADLTEALVMAVEAVLKGAK